MTSAPEESGFQEQAFGGGDSGRGGAGGGEGMGGVAERSWGRDASGMREVPRGDPERIWGSSCVLTFRVVVALVPDATGKLVAWTNRKSLSSRGQAPWTRQV